MTASKPLPALDKRLSPVALDDPDATVCPENASKEMFMNRTTLLPEVVPLAAVLFCTFVYGEPDSKRQPVAFVSVSVVPMDSERIIADQTVRIQYGRIRAIGPADTIPISETTLVARRVRRVLALSHTAQ